MADFWGSLQDDIFQWYKNGEYFASGEAIKCPTSFFNDNDKVECQMYSSYFCSSVPSNVPIIDSLRINKVSYCSVTVNLKAFIQGFYIGNGTMSAAIDPVNQPMDCDTITLALADTTTGYEIKYLAKSIIHTDGNSMFSFPLTVLGHSYYLVIRHRNSIETWSKYPEFINSETLYTDFTSQ